MKTSSIELQVIIWVVAILSVVSSALVSCPTNVSPCSCTTNTSYIVCNNVSLTAVKNLFSTNQTIPYRISQLTLFPTKNDTQIMANLTGNHTIDTLVIDCSYMINNILSVNSSAFSLTNNATKNITIQNCDLSTINWTFLKNFIQLTTIKIYKSSNLHTTFSTLPTCSFRKFSTFSVDQVKGINGFGNSSLAFPKSPAVCAFTTALTNVLIGNTAGNCTDCMIQDSAINNFFTKMMKPPGIVDTLLMMGNNLTTIPSFVGKYLVYLTNVDFSNNYQPMILKTGSFYFMFNLTTLNLNNSKISYIQDGAFQGNTGTSYQKAKVYLNNNRLTNFTKGVFNDMLNIMLGFYAGVNIAHLYVTNNSFDCSVNQQCNLKWLVKNYPYYLSYTDGAVCSNGTKFAKLNAATLTGPNNRTC